MSLTLLEASKINDGEFHRQTIIEQFAMTSDLLAVVPFMDIDGDSYAYNVEGNLPGVAFRGVNEGFTATAGVVNQQVEVLRMAGGDIDVDKYLVKGKGPEVRTMHEMMQVKMLSRTIGAKFINGDSSSEPREFDGLRVRLQGDQLLWQNGALSLATLRDLIDQVDDPTHLIMNKKMKNLLSAAYQDTTKAGFISFGQNDFGKPVTMFENLPIVVLDQDGEGNQILPFSEDDETAATSTNTSIYCANLGDEGVVGLQNGTMEVRDLGEIDVKPVYRTRVDWMVGMAVQGGQAAARLGGVTNGAVVA